jgi:uncharacterized membrane-anchored protein YitT (DUF2179 family)
VDTPSRPLPHTWLDDLQAHFTALLLISLALSLLKGGHLLTGGAPGLAFLLSYATGWPLGASLVAVNLPFMLLAWQSFGARFTLRTLVAVAVLGVGVEAVQRGLSLQHIHPLLAALASGVLTGVGLLMLLRHGASLGGINVLALTLHRTRGWPVGAVQMAIDAVIVATAFLLVPPDRVAYSVLGSLAVNAVLLWNHRPGRYPAAA